MTSWSPRLSGNCDRRQQAQVAKVTAQLTLCEELPDGTEDCKSIPDREQGNSWLVPILCSYIIKQTPFISLQRCKSSNTMTASVLLPRMASLSVKAIVISVIKLQMKLSKL